MFEQDFTSFKNLVSSSYGADYRFFDLDAGCHEALAGIDLNVADKWGEKVGWEPRGEDRV